MLRSIHERSARTVVLVILRACEYISDLVLRSGLLAASRRMTASPCVASILRDAASRLLSMRAEKVTSPIPSIALHPEEARSRRFEGRGAIRSRASWFETPRKCAAPHHEGRTFNS